MIKLEKDGTKQPILQQPVMCDFGEFAGGLCGNPTVLSYQRELTLPNLSFTGTSGSITVNDIMVEIEKLMLVEDFEKINKTKFNITNNDGKLNIGFPKVIFTWENKITKSYNYGVEDVEGNKLYASITFRLTKDSYVPVAPIAKNKSLNVNDNISNKSINIVSHFTVDSKATLNLSTMDINITKNDNVSDKVTINSNGTIVLDPDESLSTNRTIKVTYRCTDSNNLTSGVGTLTINIKDYNPYQSTIWYGNASPQNISESLVKGLSDSTVRSDFVGTYTIGEAPSSYKWIAYPRAWGEPLSITDAVTTMNVAVAPFQYVTINGVELLAIRSFYPLGGQLSVKLR